MVKWGVFLAKIEGIYFGQILTVRTTKNLLQQEKY